MLGSADHTDGTGVHLEVKAVSLELRSTSVDVEPDPGQEGRGVRGDLCRERQQLADLHLHGRLGRTDELHPDPRVVLANPEAFVGRNGLDAGRCRVRAATRNCGDCSA